MCLNRGRKWLRKNSKNSNRLVILSTVNCWWWSFPTQWWNLGVWLGTGCMVRMFNKLQWQRIIMHVFLIMFDKNLDFSLAFWGFWHSRVLSHVLTIFYLFCLFEGKCFTWLGRSLPLCLGPAAAPWTDTCTYLEVVMTMDRPIRWGS